jgi:hypothetical protein
MQFIPNTSTLVQIIIRRVIYHSINHSFNQDGNQCDRMNVGIKINTRIIQRMRVDSNRFYNDI